jgi:outer membrane protein
VRRQILLLPALALTAMMAFAQTGPTKVGVINIQSALVGTKDGQKAAQELEQKRAPKTKELERKQGEIRTLQDSLNRGGNAMAEAAKEELKRNIDTKTKSFNRDLEDAQAEWDQEQQKVLQELGQRMMVVIDKYAKDNAFSLILDVSNPNTPVLYASNTIDITKEIIDLYDKNAATLPAATPRTSAPATTNPRPSAAPTGTPTAPKPAPSTSTPIKK